MKKPTFCLRFYENVMVWYVLFSTDLPNKLNIFSTNCEILLKFTQKDLGSTYYSTILLEWYRIHLTFSFLLLLLFDVEKMIKT